LSTKELVEYLHHAGFSEDARAAIKKGKVTGEALLKLENASLQSLGIDKLGERKRLLKIIREADECCSFAFLERVDVAEWLAKEVAKWAAVNGFEEYQALLLARGVTGAQLLRMDHLLLRASASGATASAFFVSSTSRASTSSPHEATSEVTSPSSHR
jgi:hypothetical protein